MSRHCARLTCDHLPPDELRDADSRRRWHRLAAEVRETTRICTRGIWAE